MLLQVLPSGCWSADSITQVVMDNLTAASPICLDANDEARNSSYKDGVLADIPAWRVACLRAAGADVA